MTRLFEALTKARPAEFAPRVPAANVVAPPAPAPAVFAPQAPMTVVRRAAEPAPAPKPAPAPAPKPAPRDGARRRIVPLEGAPDLPVDVVRELTGLRISLEAALTERIPRTVMFIASQGGEGTSAVAAQFAQSLAADERLRVLLLDAHARRPAYGPDGAPTTAPLAGARQPASPDAPRPDLMPLSADLRGLHDLTPDLLRESIEAVVSRYDWVVIDGPPVLESPDAATLGVVADGVVVVVQAGRTKRPVLARSVDLINRGGGRVLGMVLNRRRLEIPEFIYRRI